MLTAHWRRPDVEATLSTDYLCLQSGHNDLSARLADYIDMKFKYELDVVSRIISATLHTYPNTK